MSAAFHLAQRGVGGGSEYSGSGIGAPQLDAYPDLRAWARSNRDRYVALPNNIIVQVKSGVVVDTRNGQSYYDVVVINWDENGQFINGREAVFPHETGYLPTIRDLKNTGVVVTKAEAEKIAACAKGGGKNCAQALVQQKAAAAKKSAADKEAEYLRKIAAQKGKAASSGGSRDESVALGQSGRGGGTGDSPDNVQYVLPSDQTEKPWWKNPWLWAGVGGFVFVTTIVLIATSGGPKKVAPKVVYVPPAPPVVPPTPPVVSPVVQGAA
jgi:hypothetical protein